MGREGRVLAFASSPLPLFLSPKVVLIPKEIHLNSDFHSDVVRIYVLIFKWCYLILSFVIVPLFLKVLSSLLTFCPATAQRHGCLSYLHPPHLSSSPVLLLFFFPERSTKFLYSAVFPAHLIFLQALCFSLGFNL